jgi:hypothetical protein
MELGGTVEFLITAKEKPLLRVMTMMDLVIR